MLIEGSEDALAAEIGVDINALQPPDPSVAPVAPLAGHRGLAHETALLGAPRFGHPVAETIRIGQGAGNAPIEYGRIEHLALGLYRQTAVELGNHVAIRRDGISNQEPEIDA